MKKYLLIFIALIALGISASANVRMHIEQEGNSRPYLVIENTGSECVVVTFQLYDPESGKWLPEQTETISGGETKRWQPCYCNFNNFRLNKTKGCF